VAGALFAYLLVVVPLNFLIVRRLGRSELMWVTSPAVALVFAGCLFRVTTGLSHGSTMVAATGSLVQCPDVKRALVHSTFSVFTPKAGITGLHLPNALELDAGDTTSLTADYMYKLPPAVDSGSVDVPEYRSSNLQFKTFNDLEMPREEPKVEFSVSPLTSNPSHGGVLSPDSKISLIVAKNVSDRPIQDATLVAGIYSASVDKLEPGEVMKVAVDHVTPANHSLFEETQGSDVPTTDSFRLTNPVTSAKIHGQVALFGYQDGLKIGAQLDGPVQYRSHVLISTFAPLTLELP
jgi:hypothetical protein